MKVLQINALYGSGSTGLIVEDIADCLKAHGYPSAVICINSTDTDPDIMAVGTRLGGKIHALLTRLFGRQGCWSLFSTRRLLTRIRRINPDIIHLHNLHSNFINLPLLLKYCAQNNKPVVATLHDCWYFTGKCYHFEDIGCNSWLYGCGNCPKRMADIPSILCDSSASTFRIKQQSFASLPKLHVVGCSRWITDLASRSPIFGNARFHTICNGVDLDLFKPMPEARRATGRFTILVMANKWFLPENSRLRVRLADCLDDNSHVRVVGCNEQQLGTSVSSERVSYRGYLNGREEMAEEYNNADVFLNVTFIDTLPTVNMEALGCGIPVVTYRSGGSPELIAEGHTGYIVDQGDADAVIHALGKIRGGKILKSNCRRYAERHFDKERCYHRYLDLYKQILC